MPAAEPAVAGANIRKIVWLKCSMVAGNDVPGRDCLRYQAVATASGLIDHAGRGGKREEGEGRSFRIPPGLMSEKGIEHNEQLAHAGNERDGFLAAAIKEMADSRGLSVASLIRHATLNVPPPRRARPRPQVEIQTNSAGTTGKCLSSKMFSARRCGL
jgi:hypothetical protein